MKTKQIKFEKAGYKIHFDRLRDIRPEASMIRTHKFKCVVPEVAKKEIWEKFERVGGVVDSSEKGSLMWFLIQLYSLGFLFVSKEGGKKALLRKLYKIDLEEVESGSKYYRYIKNEEAFQALMAKGFRGIKVNDEDKFLSYKIIKSLGEIFEIDKKISAENMHEFSIVKECHDELLLFVKERKSLGAADLQDFFAVKIEKENTEGSTFIIQEVALIELQENAKKILDGDGIDVYTAYFRYLSKAAQASGYDIQSLAGVSENQNALSNLFNKALVSFQRSVDDCSRLLTYGNPEFFKNNKEVLEFLAKIVHELAKKVAIAENVDFIAGNWAEYRTLIGGRLQGWLSNFKNRIDTFNAVLSDDGQHKKVFDRIEKNCDWEHIFSEAEKFNFEQLKILREKLFEALKALKGEENNFTNDRDFGSLLEEYNQYLQGFREFLIKWNNEGIPNEIDKNTIKFSDKNFLRDISFSLNTKELCEKNEKKGVDENEKELLAGRIYKWAMAAVPQELDHYPRFIGVAKKDPKEQIKNASENVCKLAFVALKFAKDVRQINLEKRVQNFNEKKWLSADFGLLHKNIEGLKKLAARFDMHSLKNSKSFKFIQKFVDLENTKSDEKQIKIWQNIELVSGKNSKEIKNLLHKNDFQKNHYDLNKIKFYLSGYERRSNGFIAIKETDFTQYLAKFEQHFELENLSNESDLRKWLRLDNGVAGSDANERGEILKIYLSLLLRDIEGKVILPQDEESYKIFIKTSLASLVFENLKLKQSLDILALRRFLQAGVASEIRGNISLLSRKDFIQRQVIQITNGEQSCLRYVPVEWGNFDDLEKSLGGAKIKGKRNKFTKKRLQKIKDKAKKSFSQNSLEVLDSAGIDVLKTNAEIAEEIWKNFSKQTPGAQRKLAQVLGEMPHRFESVLRVAKKIENLSCLENGLLIEKSKGESIFQFSLLSKKQKDFLYSFPIQTSIYQKQFLERFLWQDKCVKDGGELQFNLLTESLMGATIIVEKAFDVSWSKAQSVDFEERDFVFYCAIPFQISKEDGDRDAEIAGQQRLLNEDFAIKNAEGKIQKQNRREENILGIDLGEYGFGWAVFNVKAGKFIAKDFQAIPLLKKMRDEAANWKDAQASGIFARPTTYLADIREKTAGQVRNQIHHLALKHNAVPVYEIEIDGFESGGQRISKLYKTLKTSDVFSKNSNEADKAVRKHFWGAEGAIGVAVDAAQTSQTCRKCGGCATDEIKSGVEDKIEVRGGKVLDKILCDKENGFYDKKDIANFIKRTQRSEGANGGQSKFICQYSDCDNKDCHADEQAAENIALKFYFKISDKFKERRDTLEGEEKKFYDKNGKFLTTKFFLEESRRFAIRRQCC